MPEDKRPTIDTVFTQVKILIPVTYNRPTTDCTIVRRTCINV